MKKFLEYLKESFIFGFNIEDVKKEVAPIANKIILDFFGKVPEITLGWIKYHPQEDFQSIDIHLVKNENSLICSIWPCMFEGPPVPQGDNKFSMRMILFPGVFYNQTDRYKTFWDFLHPIQQVKYFNYSPEEFQKCLYYCIISLMREGSKEFLEFLDINQETQEKLIIYYPELISKIPNLDLKLKEKHKNVKKGSEAGFY